jgi:hypothetical protein
VEEVGPGRKRTPGVEKDQDQDQAREEYKDEMRCEIRKRRKIEKGIVSKKLGNKWLEGMGTRGRQKTERVMGVISELFPRLTREGKRG